MNDEDFIIISSDEETDTTNVSKEIKTSVVNDDKSEQLLENGASCSSKQYSISSSKNQETAQCSPIQVVDGISNSSSEDSKCNISIEPNGSSNANEVLNNQKESAENDKNDVKNDAEINTNNLGVVKHMEMSTTFKKFIDIVLPLEENEVDRATLLKKITKYHNLTDPNYLSSEEWNKKLENGISNVTKKPSSLYYVIKDVLDCLLSKRIIDKYEKSKRIKSGPEGDDSKEKGEEGDTSREISICFDEDDKNYKTIKKLTKTLKKLENKIKEAEEAEVDLSDEEDSNYLKMQRYRERFCQVYKKLCTYNNQTSNAKRLYSRKIHFNGTKNLNLDRAIESWLNKTMQFPDFASVLKFLKESNENLDLGWSKEKLKRTAEDVFVKIGNSLQLRRKYDLWESFNSFLESEVDPSTTDSALRERLDANFEIALKKEKEILNYYAELQVENKLEPREIPDEEANHSPVESGDEDENEIEAAENMLSSRIAVDVEDDGEETEPDENDGEDESPPARDGEGEAGNVDAENCDPSAEVEQILNDSVKVENAGSSHRGDDSVAIKDESCKVSKNCESVVLGVKRSPDVESLQYVKKPKLTKKTNSPDHDSDCEVVIVLSDEETNCKSDKNGSFEIKKVHQVNYAFINNSFNHSATLTRDDLVLKRRSCYSRFKIGKTRRRSLPLADLTNVKHIAKKDPRISGGQEKRKIQESTRLHSFERSRFKHSQFMLPDKMNTRCALQNESGVENLKSQNEKDSCEERSNEEAISSSNNGGSAGGGSGQDNNEDNGNKKPSDPKNQSDDNKEGEEEEEDDEGDKERPQADEKHEKEDEINGVDPDKSNGNGDVETHIIDEDTFLGPQQLVRVTIDPPPPSKRRSAIPRARRIPNNKTRGHKNGGLPTTSRFISTKYPFNCKPYVGNIRNARGKPRQSLPLNLSEVEIRGAQRKKPSPQVKAVKSDEEIVKNFLQHSPSSISITTPRKRVIENQPSPSILQAIQTLSRLKSITTTVVKASSSEQEGDVTVIRESPKKIPKRTNPSSNRRNQSFLLPKIVTVQGNVSGFESMDAGQAIDNFPGKSTPSSKRRGKQRSQFQNQAGSQRKDPRQTKKDVEYVVLD